MEVDLDPKRVIRRAMKFPMDEVLRRYAKEQDLPMKTAKEHERELKRFLALGAMSSKRYGMTGPIDELWHTFVIFTKLYSTFCQKVAGRFIHHYPSVPKPSDPSDRRSQAEQLRKDYQRFLDDYQKTFGEEPPRHLWPRLTLKQTEFAAGCACTDTDGCDLISGCTCVDGGEGEEGTTGEGEEGTTGTTGD